MIPVFVLKGVEPIAALKPFAGARDQALRLLPQLDPGDILSARVEAKLPDGSYKVLIHGQPLRMSLPGSVAPGDTLELTFAAREPRLTFSLDAAAQAGAPPAPQLSAAGRLIAATMLQPGELAVPLSASSAEPLLTAPAAGGARLAGALAQALGQSGLFYEAHLAQWQAGKRHLSQLRQEPQARLMDTAATRCADTPAESSVTATTLCDAASIDARAVSLVQQQLAALDSARVLLQIQAWPGQWMYWEVGDEQPGAGQEPPQAQCWTTRLRMELPQLGEFKAALRLDAQGLRIRLEAGSADSAALLRAHRADLRAALAAAGVPAAAIAVTQHEQH